VVVPRPPLVLGALLRLDADHHLARERWEVGDHLDAFLREVMAAAIGLAPGYLPPGKSVKATPLSTRTSWGRPSTRSAMMLRRISSDPPAMRRPGAHM
jgi:hypothetical protein